MKDPKEISNSAKSIRKTGKAIDDSRDLNSDIATDEINQVIEELRNNSKHIQSYSKINDTRLQKMTPGIKRRVLVSKNKFLSIHSLSDLRKVKDEMMNQQSNISKDFSNDETFIIPFKTYDGKQGESSLETKSRTIFIM